MKNLKGIVYEILNNTPDSPLAVGTYSIISEVVLQPTCNYSATTNLHDIYRCASLSKVMSTEISEEVEKFNGVFQGEECSNIYHIFFFHMKFILLIGLFKSCSR